MHFRVWPLLFVAACAPAANDVVRMDKIEVVEASDQSLRKPYVGPTYFPPGLGKPTVRCKFGDRPLQPILSDFERDWYSHQLAAANEPSLYLASQAKRPASAGTLRFTWLRSFHVPVVIRIETSGPNAHRLVAKQLSGAGGYDPGKVAKTIDRPLTPTEVERLQTVLTRSRVFEVPPDPCGGGCDGAQWIFEAVEKDQYRFASLWTPQGDPARDVGQFLMSLTGWKFEEVY